MQKMTKEELEPLIGDVWEFRGLTGSDYWIIGVISSDQACMYRIDSTGNMDTHSEATEDMFSDNGWFLIERDGKPYIEEKPAITQENLCKFYLKFKEWPKFEVTDDEGDRIEAELNLADRNNAYSDEMETYFRLFDAKPLSEKWTAENLKEG